MNQNFDFLFQKYADFEMPIQRSQPETLKIESPEEATTEEPLMVDAGITLRPHGPYFYSPTSGVWRKIKF